MAEKSEALIGFRRLPEEKLTESHLQGDEKIPQRVIEIIDENAKKIPRGFTSLNEPICPEGTWLGGRMFTGVDITLNSEGEVEEIHCPKYQSYISGCSVTKDICKILQIVGPKKMKSSGM